MGFEEEYQSFLNAHLQARTGERLRRLQEGHKQAEKLFLKQVWWPLFYQFKYLHPEYEIDDYKDGKRYLDFAYIRPGIRICLEVDGYGPHLKNISRWQFSDNLERQNQLVIDRWTVIRFSFDQVKENPRRCQQVVQQVIGRWLGDELDQTSLSFLEKEVLRLVIRKGEDISPTEVEKYLKLSDKTVKKILSQLVEKKMLIPTSGTKRIHAYRLGEQVKDPV
ncbi:MULTISPECIES: BlaI/MecI/CopY family transcriptional regulator [unclassified Bacillus (in: firmicutes)]|uniref:BlaI/MecI/CopY family transcriptional regulator n=1 Tax=unclassified Bacillus (in: firmicutes) TaxID=185979 RepID=UPI001BEA1B18|nr:MULTISPECIES: BlaI/MecI/CopY family transcriptional regulator [unclassified Bacillus (in: firmicutes)]MBT2638732.1 BlaI/MecI/CopY family transcriptional regulator [Bacillus sp. ISL-39]MBT2663717.1 BlaI/MecI/CopY family transcriptional regulator [Bacillus sp. ISL-45]